MSILAGVYCRDQKLAIPGEMRNALRRSISRRPDEEIIGFGDGRAYLAKVDIGSFGEIGHLNDPDVCLLAGEILLSSPGGSANRLDDLRRIDADLCEDKTELLQQAEGVFSVACYRPEAGSLTLLTDKLGIRPLYYWMDDQFIVFASALRILESLDFIPKKMNLRAITEIAGLGYALHNRTPYDGIYLLTAGEILNARDGEVSNKHYWRWDNIPVSDEPEADLTRSLFGKFEQGVMRRLRGDSTTVAYLSGGLDSRCVVAALCDVRARVHTFNFARLNTQDLVFGRQFADAIGVIHGEIPKDSGDHVPDYSAKMAQAWAASQQRVDYPAERPALVWSGEGGSVALGHVHLGQRIVEAMRAGNTDAAIDEYFEKETIYVSPKLLNPAISVKPAALIRQGIKDELDRLSCSDPARNFYLFLMLNDQRRKLAGHFEDIDLNRLEFQLPFFDGAFLETILSIPVDLSLRHKLYVKWLYLFPPAVTGIPWQAYPGHEPCPLPVPDGMSYQWDKKYLTNEQKTVKRRLVAQADTLLKAEDFPLEILSKNNFRLATWIHRTGWRDYSYVIESANLYHKYWRICGGSYTL